MLINSLKSRRDDEEGFTLIELMVVVLIIAILIAIAIPTFLGARERAQNRAAQSDLRNGLTAEKTFYTDDELFTNDVPSLEAIEPSLSWATVFSTTDLFVGVDTQVINAGDTSAVCLAKVSKSGRVFGLADVAIGVGAGTYYISQASGNPCSGFNATNAAGAGLAGWSTDSNTGW
ncbi:MAG: prepilin-type N-terminal cleavage/methylation domain-containing protein [Acidimicrobiia bacterium]